MDRGVLPVFAGAAPQAAQYLEAYKRNLYCVKSANLNGQIPADITGQFVTNNMPQLYPRDAMMCARVLLLTGHPEEAKQVIEFWAKPEIPMKTPGEWYARYDAHGQAVNGGTGARFDEPEWDSNGYYIYLLNQYHEKQGVWLASPQFIYKLADFLVDHLSSNGLLWEGGIVEWTGYLPATNMIDAAALRITAKMAREFGDTARAGRYSATAQTISAALPKMFDKTRQTYADVRFTAQKETGGISSTEQSGQKIYLWDTTANVGLIWGYPNHREIELSNIFYDHNTVKLGGGMQYFDSPNPGLASYGHGIFFFTTAAAAEYQTLYGTKSAAKNFIDWMIRNANSYGLMPEHISPDGSECSPASPLSWCCAEFAAALRLWSM
jgi:GH15 family glucan-1,4-alpha-glucosidase